MKSHASNDLSNTRRTRLDVSLEFLSKIEDMLYKVNSDDSVERAMIGIQKSTLEEKIQEQQDEIDLLSQQLDGEMTTAMTVQSIDSGERRAVDEVDSHDVSSRVLDSRAYERSCRIKVHLNSSKDFKRLQGRRDPSAYAKSTINKRICRVHQKGEVHLTEQIESVTILGSGDLRISMSNPMDAERLIKFSNQWVYALGPYATVAKTTYGVVMHDMLVESFHPTNQLGMIKKLEEENAFLVGTGNVESMFWLKPRLSAHLHSSSMLVQFKNPSTANNAIRNGALCWNGVGCRTIRFEKHHQLKQCCNCYRYAHRSVECTRTRICPKCAAEGHGLGDCPRDSAKCFHCGGGHDASSPECLQMVKEHRKMREAKDQLCTQPLWPEPEVTPSSSEMKVRIPM